MGRVVQRCLMAISKFSAEDVVGPLFLAAAGAGAAVSAYNKDDIKQRSDDITKLRQHADLALKLLRSPAAGALPRLRDMVFQVYSRLLRTVKQAENANDLVQCNRP